MLTRATSMPLHTQGTVPLLRSFGPQVRDDKENGGSRLLVSGYGLRRTVRTVLGGRVDGKYHESRSSSYSRAILRPVNHTNIADIPAIPTAPPKSKR